MKNLFSWLFNPMALVIASMGFFAVALVDSISHEASSFSDLGPIGKIFTILCMSTFGWLILVQWVLPLIIKKKD